MKGRSLEGARDAEQVARLAGGDLEAHERELRDAGKAVHPVQAAPGVVEQVKAERPLADAVPAAVLVDAREQFLVGQALDEFHDDSPLHGLFYRRRRFPEPRFAGGFPVDGTF